MKEIFHFLILFCSLFRVDGCKSERHGSWSGWSNIGSCSVSCGPGHQMQVRSCSNPWPDNGGNWCRGASNQMESCNHGPCPIHGGWSHWDDSGICSVTCGSGQKTKIRHCNNPTPQHNGEECPGPNSEKIRCNENPCPIDGGWSTWYEVGTCSATCGTGTQNLGRNCGSPLPQHGGLNCKGNPFMVTACEKGPCPIAGGWSDWSHFPACSATCGGGFYTRLRFCDNPEPQHGGAECKGQPSDTMACNSFPCPVNGNWGEWEGWETCSVSCGGGFHIRKRYCNNPAAAHGGAHCFGDQVDKPNICGNQSCPIDGGWGNWGSYGDCSATCGGGTQNRFRFCNNPTPQHGGESCKGNSTEILKCNPKACPTSEPYGGLEVAPHSLPYQVGLVDAADEIEAGSKVPFCGGALISLSHVLTSAHCTVGKASGSFVVVIGEHNYKIPDEGEQYIKVESILHHPNYDPFNTHKADFSIIKLAEKVELSETAATICLSSSKIVENEDLVISGWGKTSSIGKHAVSLKSAKVLGLSNEDCVKQLPSMDYQITRNHICVLNPDIGICNGDSGGPLVANVKGRPLLVGLSSGGVECESKTNPGIFARISAQMDWILANSDANVCAHEDPDGDVVATSTRTVIVGGSRASLHAAPYLVGLTQMQVGSQPFCSGALITQKFVLTAAHCTAGKNASTIKVVVGEHIFTEANVARLYLSVKSIIDYPLYLPSHAHKSDLALLRLNQTIKPSETVKPIKLTNSNSPTFAGDTAWIFGWGGSIFNGPKFTSLRMSKVQVLENENCLDQHITSHHLCAAPTVDTDTCVGDGGGPLVATVDNVTVLIGVSSMSHCSTSPSFPGLFTRVSSLKKWIQDTMDKENLYISSPNL